MLGNGSVSINAGVFWMLGAALAISAYNVIQRLYANGYKMCIRDRRLSVAYCIPFSALGWHDLRLAGFPISIGG